MKSRKPLKPLIVLAVIFGFVFILFIVVHLYLRYNVISYTSYDSNLMVGDYVGINLDTDKLYFGTTRSGGKSFRGLTINSSNAGYFYVTSTGDLSNMLYKGYEIERVEQGSENFMVFYAVPPLGLPDGEYEATIHIYILKSKFLSRLYPGLPVKLYDSSMLGELGGSQIRINLT